MNFGYFKVYFCHRYMKFYILNYRRSSVYKYQIKVFSTNFVGMFMMFMHSRFYLQ